MGSKRIGQVRFVAYSGDHRGAAIPHLHGFIGGGEIIVSLLPGGRVGLSNAHNPVKRGSVTKSEERAVLAAAEAAYDVLLALWKDSQ